MDGANRSRWHGYTLVVSGHSVIDDTHNVCTYMVCRPRTAAAAEVLWSGRYDDKGHKRDLGNAMLRIFDWRYRLVKRGIQAEALQPLWW